MRWPFYILVPSAIALAIGCNALTTDTTSGSSSGDAGSTCPQTNGCSDCTSCALSGPCAELYSACNESADCSGIDQCEGSCGDDTTCKQQCEADNPNGVSAWQAVTNCIDCQQCPTACAGLCGT